MANLVELQGANLVGEHARHVEDVNNQIIAQLKQLITDLEPMATEWQGSAGSAFQTLKAEHHDKQHGLTKVLNDIAVALAGNQSEYNKAETTSQGDLDKLTAQTSAIQNKMNPHLA